MSSLWTPDGERPIRREPAAPAPMALDADDPAGEGEASPEELEAMQEELQQMQSELAAVPAAAVIANHVIGLFQLAAVHLQTIPPNVPDAQLSIDSMALPSSSRNPDSFMYGPRIRLTTKPGPSLQ